MQLPTDGSHIDNAHNLFERAHLYNINVMLILVAIICSHNIYTVYMLLHILIITKRTA